MQANDWRDDGSSQLDMPISQPRIGYNTTGYGNGRPSMSGSSRQVGGVRPAADAQQSEPVKVAPKSGASAAPAVVKYSKFKTTQMSHLYSGPVAIVSMSQKSDKNNNPYTEYTIQDSSGQVSAKWFSTADTTNKVGDIVLVEAMAGEWLGRPQYTFRSVRQTKPGEIPLTEVIPSTPFNIEEMKKDFLRRMEWIKDDCLQKIVQSCFGIVQSRLGLDYVGTVPTLVSFCECPASKEIHHNYVGGLLEHTSAMIRYADAMAPLQGLDPDLIVAGVMLHDLGKIWEYSWIPVIDYTPRGKLFGHLAMGYAHLKSSTGWIGKSQKEIDYVDQLSHIILSHHEKPEYGTCVLPQTREAILVAEIDKLDVYEWRTKYLFEGNKSQRLPNDFALKTSLYRFN